MKTPEALREEIDRREEELRLVKVQVQRAEEAFRFDRDNYQLGQEVVRLTGQVRLKELALEGAQQELSAADAPRRVVPTGSRDYLEGRRRELAQKLEYRETVRQREIARVREAFEGAPERHLQIELQNKQLDPPSFGYMRETKQIEAQIEHLDQQLEVLEAQESASGVA